MDAILYIQTAREEMIEQINCKSGNSVVSNCNDEINYENTPDSDH